MGEARHATRRPLAAWGLAGLTTTAFAAALLLTGLNASRLDADAVTEDLARSVSAALEPAHVSIWLSERR
jgi:hypothetical protein